MKKLWNYNYLVGLFLLFVLMACQQTNNETKNKQQYTCSMHPQIIRDKPGNCPICAMELVPIHQKEMKMEVDANLADLIQPANESIISNVKTLKVFASSVLDTIFLNGLVSYNTNNLNSVSSRISGRIERLFVKYNFQKVTKGQKLMEIYSPDLAASQQELLYLKNIGDTPLLEQAKSRLRLLGVGENQLQQILKSGKVNYKIAIFSPVSGYLVDDAQNESLKTSLKNNQEMGSTSSSISTNNTALNLVEGQYVNVGDVLFKLFNENEVWAEFYADANQLLRLKENIIIKNKNGQQYPARIDFIQPFFKDRQNYKLVRVYLKNNDQNFRVGELLSAKILLPKTKGLWIPKTALYALGDKNIVFIKKGNVLKPIMVEKAAASNTQFLISKGLNEGDEIAGQASYLIDTESFIKTEN